MPYRWQEEGEAAEVALWPHQSLTAKGFVWFIGPTAVLFALPLLAVLNSPVFLVLLGFFGATVWAVWRAIMANRRARSVVEVLRLQPDALHLAHQPPDADAKTWDANPYWVEVLMAAEGGPVENYLTLRGAGREVELGAFLTPQERIRLRDDLEARLWAIRQPLG